MIWPLQFDRTEYNEIKSYPPTAVNIDAWTSLADSFDTDESTTREANDDLWKLGPIKDVNYEVDHF